MDDLLVNEEFSIPSLPQSSTYRYSKDIKFLPKMIDVWQDVWHNSKCSMTHKSRRKG